jgi:hypothetical protein
MRTDTIRRAQSLPGIIADVADIVEPSWARRVVVDWRCCVPSAHVIVTPEKHTAAIHGVNPVQLFIAAFGMR